MNITPAAALALVDKQLAAVLDDARAIRGTGPRKTRLAVALVTARAGAMTGGEVGCLAAIAALAGVQAEAKALASAPDGKVRRCAKAAATALPALRAIDWHVTRLPVLALGPAPAPTAPSLTDAVALDVPVTLSAPAAGVVSAAWTLTGLDATDLADGLLAGSVVVAAGRPGASIPLRLAPKRLTVGKAGVLSLSSPFGCTLPSAASSVPVALLANAQPLPTVSLAGPGDIAVSATAEVDAAATLTLSAPTDHDVTATYALTGQQDGDLLVPATGPVLVTAGQGSAPIPVLVAPLALTADRVLTLTLTGVVGAGGPIPPPVNFALRKNTVVPRGQINFAEPIGQVQRHPTDTRTVMVKLRRDNCPTDAAATAPAPVVSGLPPGVVQVAPADFAPRSQYGYAPFHFSPSGTSVRAAVAAAPLTGRADLVATDTLDLGSDASQQFTVADGRAAGPGGDNPFHAPGVDLGPIPFLLGYSMNIHAADRAVWVREIGRPPLCASGGSRINGRTQDWFHLRGGDKGAILRGSQLDPGSNGQTTLANAFDVLSPADGAVVVTCWSSVPDTIQPGDYAGLATGSHDDDAYVFGWNAWLLMKGRGYSGARLVTRFDKEYTLGGYGVTAANAAQRAAFQARFIASFNKGYLDAGADARPLHVLGAARHQLMGPLEAHVPVGPNGQVMIDAVDVSMHPPNQGLSAYVGRPWDAQVAAVREWIRGGYEGACYAPDHADPRYSGLVVARNHGIRISNFESSPRDDQYACPISAAAWQGLFDFWSEHAAELAGVGVYNHTALDRGLNIPGWADGVAAFVRLARGG